MSSSPTPSPSPVGRGAVCNDCSNINLQYLFKSPQNHITPLPTGEGTGVGPISL